MFISYKEGTKINLYILSSLDLWKVFNIFLLFSCPISPISVSPPDVRYISTSLEAASS